MHPSQPDLAWVSQGWHKQFSTPRHFFSHFPFSLLLCPKHSVEEAAHPKHHPHRWPAGSCSTPSNPTGPLSSAKPALDGPKCLAETPLVMVEENGCALAKQHELERVSRDRVSGDEQDVNKAQHPKTVLERIQADQIRLQYGPFLPWGGWIIAAG